MFGIHLPTLPGIRYNGPVFHPDQVPSLMDNGAPPPGGDDDKGGGGDKPWWETAITDEGLRGEAQRYKTPEDAIKSLVDTKKELRTRTTKDDPMPDVGDGKDEAKVQALTQWRERHGIPADPTGYKLNEEVTKRLVDADKPLIENFTQVAHAKGQPQAVVDFATQWYVEAMEQEAVRTAENDKNDGKKAEDALRDDWKSNYRQNFDFAVTTAKQVLGDRYDGQSIFEARLPNGMKLGSIPEFVKGMHQVGLAIFGDGAFVGEEAAKATESRKAEIQQIMKTDFNQYIEKGLDKEYQAIIEAEAKRPQR
jgi:hypothetical protein